MYAGNVLLYVCYSTIKTKTINQTFSCIPRRTAEKHKLYNSKRSKYIFGKKSNKLFKKPRV